KVHFPMETRKSPSAVESKFSLSECKMENAMDNGAKNIESVLRDSHSGDQDHHINTPDPSLVDGTNTSPKQSDLSHAVNCTVTIALAVPRAAQTKAKAKRIRLAEAPKAQSFYHVEYCLFPDDPNPVKVDLVMCGLAAKVYMASETKVLKPWQEGDKMWLGWSQSFKLKVTKELLIKMATHKITFHVWDDKDKVSCRVRSDRSFTLPQGRNEEGSRQSGTQSGTVFKFVKNYYPVMTHKPIRLYVVFLVGCSGWAYEGLCNISLDQPLMSDRLKDELNPLVITILAGTSLPSSPVPLHVLQERCLPVYCQYKFPNMDVHKTKGHMHRANIYFRDVNVILSGLLSSAELLEFFKGPPLDIEVHDRDRKVAKPFPGPAVFGSEPQDNKLGSVGLMKLADNPSPQKGQPSDPYGVASLCFSDLLCGEQKVKLNLPIRCSPPSRPGDQRPRCSEKETLAISSSADCSPHMTVPVGHYFDANSQLKVQIEIAHPVGVESITWDGDCPFGRIIYIFKHNSASNLTTLLSEIFRINAAAFRLENTTDGGLSQHKWNVKHRENKDLDVITGFHIFDKCLHLFVLEGLKDQLGQKNHFLLCLSMSGLHRNEDEQVTILYNSTLCFSKRLYSALDEGFGTIHLDEPLETIMQQPLVFVRDVLPHTCFKALSRITNICQVSSLTEVVRNNLFPTAEMVLSLRGHFGTDPGKREENPARSQQIAMEISEQKATGKAYKPLETYNQDYIVWKQHTADQTSLMNLKPKPQVIVAELEESRTAHNYSIQAMNSTAQAKELLRKEMAKTTAQRFSYCLDYHSATVDLQDADAERKAEEVRSREAWRTFNGFVYRGFRSSIESNANAKHPDEARVEEENILHANVLNPTLDRCRWPWVKRSQDFELYTKPPRVFGPVPPISIHLAGTFHNICLHTYGKQISTFKK
uniref:Cilia and flagella associated protein 92 (putative) n=1 Tax=Denticeps clupeoides TaxID=299321 RepID=A0AAY4EAL9_9TELE